MRKRERIWKTIIRGHWLLIFFFFTHFSHLYLNCLIEGRSILLGKINISCPLPFSNSRAEALNIPACSRLSSDTLSMVIGAYGRSQAEGVTPVMVFMASYYRGLSPCQEDHCLVMICDKSKTPSHKIIGGGVGT